MASDKRWSNFEIYKNVWGYVSVLQEPLILRESVFGPEYFPQLGQV